LDLRCPQMAMKRHKARMVQNRATVGDIVRKLLPNGSLQGLKNPSWDKCPEWGADIFAVAASIVQASSCYVDPGIALSGTDADSQAKRDRATLHERTGKSWTISGTVPNLVRSHWSTLFKAFNSPINDQSQRSRKWKRAALALVAITDEAFAGAGFFPEKQD